MTGYSPADADADSPDADRAVPSPPPRRSWLRHNALALALLVAIVPGLVGVLVVFPLSEQATDIRTVQEIPAGASAQLEGYEWTLTDSREFPGEGIEKNQVPVGTSLIAAIIVATPTGDTPPEMSGCEITLTSRATGTERTWPKISNLYDYNYRIADDSQGYCQLISNEPFNLEVVFLAPEGSYAGSTVDLAFTGNDETMLRFSLPDQE